MKESSQQNKLEANEYRNPIGVNAIQTFCLMRNVPLIFGDGPESNAYWRLLLLLLQILNILFSPVITERTTIRLKHVIISYSNNSTHSKTCYPNTASQSIIPGSYEKLAPFFTFGQPDLRQSTYIVLRTLKIFKNITDISTKTSDGNSITSVGVVTFGRHWLWTCKDSESMC